MAQRIGTRTKISRGMIVRYIEPTIKRRVVGKVIRIKTYGRRQLVYLSLEPGLEALGRRDDFKKLKAEIITLDELITFMNDAIYRGKKR